MGRESRDGGETEGTYTLLVALSSPAKIEVGALGRRSFEAGWYAYTGSALGPGGFARVERHCELAAGERNTRHWHVDYLLGHPDTSVDAVVRVPGADVECRISQSLAGEPIDAFGASDCDCETHLRYSDQRDDLLRSIEHAASTVGDAATVDRL